MVTNKIVRNLLKTCCLAAFITGGASAALAKQNLAIDVDSSKETISLSVRSTSPHKVFLLPSPDRLVVDIPAVGSRPDTDMPERYKGNLIKRVRFGQFDPKTWRLVFDLNQPVRVLNEKDANGHIVIDIAAGEAAARESIAPDNSSSAPTQVWPGDTKKKIAAEDYSIKGTRSEKKHSDNSASKGKSAKPLIVIDPGHGGVDPGAKGPAGTLEKDLVLVYARELRNKLIKSGRYQVLLTRDDDEIIMLRKRVEIARKAGAKMFISLHADSAPEDDVQGFSVYTVSQQASDQESEALAARENKADVLTGMDLSDEREDVAGILISLAERETKNRSATLADILVTSLDGKVQLLPNSHRFAGFAVLKAPDVPSVLVEIGFLSHPREEKLINSKAYRDKIINGIASGVDEYFRLEKRMGDS